jgi:hypothetical protein
MADAVLHVKVDPSGVVAGSTAAAVSLDKLSAAAAPILQQNPAL